MQKAIQQYVLTNWGKLVPSNPKPRALSTLQISRSHGKEYRFGRIVHMLFEEGTDLPLVVARFCRHSGYEDSLISESDFVRGLDGTVIGSNVPKILDTPIICGKRVVLEEAVPGIPVSVLARNEFYNLGLDAFKEAVGRHFEKASSFLKSLRSLPEGGAVSARAGMSDIGPIVSKYSGWLKLNGAEEYAVNGIGRAAEALVCAVTSPCVMHGDYTPSNIFLSEDGGMKVIDWEFASYERLGFLDTMRFIYYYYGILDSLGVFGEDGFHETFIERSNWFSSMSLDFARNIEGEKVKDAEDFRTLFACFLIFEAGLQLDVTGMRDSSDMRDTIERINNLSGFSSLKEREYLFKENERLLKEREDLLKVNEQLQSDIVSLKDNMAEASRACRGAVDGLSKTIEQMVNSKSWKLTYPLRLISGMMKGVKAE